MARRHDLQEIDIEGPVSPSLEGQDISSNLNPEQREAAKVEYNEDGTPVAPETVDPTSGSGPESPAGVLSDQVDVSVEGPPEETAVLAQVDTDSTLEAMRPDVGSVLSVIEDGIQRSQERQIEVRQDWELSETTRQPTTTTRTGTTSTTSSSDYDPNLDPAPTVAKRRTRRRRARSYLRSRIGDLDVPELSDLTDTASAVEEAVTSAAEGGLQISPAGVENAMQEIQQALIGDDGMLVLSNGNLTAGDPLEQKIIDELERLYSADGLDPDSPENRQQIEEDAQQIITGVPHFLVARVLRERFDNLSPERIRQIAERLVGSRWPEGVEVNPAPVSEAPTSEAPAPTGGSAAPEQEVARDTETRTAGESRFTDHRLSHLESTLRADVFRQVDTLLENSDLVSRDAFTPDDLRPLARDLVRGLDRAKLIALFVNQQGGEEGVDASIAALQAQGFEIQDVEQFKTNLQSDLIEDFIKQGFEGRHTEELAQELSAMVAGLAQERIAGEVASLELAAGDTDGFAIAFRVLNGEGDLYRATVLAAYREKTGKDFLDVYREGCTADCQKYIPAIERLISQGSITAEQREAFFAEIGDIDRDGAAVALTPMNIVTAEEAATEQVQGSTLEQLSQKLLDNVESRDGIVEIWKILGGLEEADRTRLLAQFERDNGTDFISYYREHGYKEDTYRYRTGENTQSYYDTLNSGHLQIVESLVRTGKAEQVLMNLFRGHAREYGYASGEMMAGHHRDWDLDKLKEMRREFDAYKAVFAPLLVENQAFAGHIDTMAQRYQDRIRIRILSADIYGRNIYIEHRAGLDDDATRSQWRPFWQRYVSLLNAHGNVPAQYRVVPGADLYSRMPTLRDDLVAHAKEARDRVQECIDAGKERAEIMHAAMAGMGCNTKQLYGALYRSGSEDRYEMYWARQRFEQIAGKSLNSFVNAQWATDAEDVTRSNRFRCYLRDTDQRFSNSEVSELVQMPWIDTEVDYILSNNPLKIAAVELRESVRAADPVPTAIDTFSGRSAPERIRILEYDHELSGREYLDDIRERRPVEEFALIKALVDTGKFTDLQLAEMLGRRFVDQGELEGAIQGSDSQSQNDVEDLAAVQARFDEMFKPYEEILADNPELLQKLRDVREQTELEARRRVVASTVLNYRKMIGMLRYSPLGEQTDASGTVTRISDAARADQYERQLAAYMEEQQEFLDSDANTEFKAEIERRGTQAHREGVDLMKKALTATTQLHHAMEEYWWGTDEEKVYAALKDCSDEERALITSLYADRYGSDLRTIIEMDFEGDGVWYDKAIALYRGDLAGAYAADAYIAMTGFWGPNTEKLAKVYEEIHERSGENPTLLADTEQRVVDEGYIRMLVERNTYHDPETGETYHRINPNITSLTEAIDELYSGDDRALILATRENDKIAIGAIKLHRMLGYMNDPEKDICHLLEEQFAVADSELTQEATQRYIAHRREQDSDYNPETVKLEDVRAYLREQKVRDFALAYAQLYDEDFDESKINFEDARQFLVDQLTEEIGGPELGWAKAVIAGDQVAADAHKMRFSLQRAWTSPHKDLWLEALEMSPEVARLEESNPELYAQRLQEQVEHNAAVNARYEELYGRGIVADARRYTAVQEWHNTLGQRIANGRLSDGERIAELFGDQAIFTDGEQELIAIAGSYEGASAEEVEKLKADFRAMTVTRMHPEGADLFARANTELSGDDYFDFMVNFEVEGDSEHERIMSRATRRYDHAQSGVLHSANLEEIYTELQELYSRATEDDRVPTEGELEQMRGLMNRLNDQADAFRAYKGMVGDTVAMVGTTVVVVAVTVGTAGAGTAPTVMFVVVGTASFATNAGLKAAFKGDSYGVEEGATDLAFAGIDALAMVGGSVLARKAIEAAAKQMVRRGLVRAGKEVTEEALERGVKELLESNALRVALLQGGLEGTAEYPAGFVQSVAVADHQNKSLIDVLGEAHGQATVRMMIGQGTGVTFGAGGHFWRRFRGRGGPDIEAPTNPGGDPGSNPADLPPAGAPAADATPAGPASGPDVDAPGSTTSAPDAPTNTPDIAASGSGADADLPTGTPVEAGGQRGPTAPDNVVPDAPVVDSTPITPVDSSPAPVSTPEVDAQPVNVRPETQGPQVIRPEIDGPSHSPSTPEPTPSTLVDGTTPVRAESGSGAMPDVEPPVVSRPRRPATDAGINTDTSVAPLDAPRGSVETAPAPEAAPVTVERTAPVDANMNARGDADVELPGTPPELPATEVRVERTAPAPEAEAIPDTVPLRRTDLRTEAPEINTRADVPPARRDLTVEEIQRSLDPRIDPDGPTRVPDEIGDPTLRESDAVREQLWNGPERQARRNYHDSQGVLREDGGQPATQPEALPNAPETTTHVETVEPSSVLDDVIEATNQRGAMDEPSSVLDRTIEATNQRGATDGPSGARDSDAELLDQIIENQSRIDAGEAPDTPVVAEPETNVSTTQRPEDPIAAREFDVNNLRQKIEGLEASGQTDAADNLRPLLNDMEADLVTMRGDADTTPARSDAEPARTDVERSDTEPVRQPVDETNAPEPVSNSSTDVEADAPASDADILEQRRQTLQSEQDEAFQRWKDSNSEDGSLYDTYQEKVAEYDSVVEQQRRLAEVEERVRQVNREEADLQERLRAGEDAELREELELKRDEKMELLEERQRVLDGEEATRTDTETEGDSPHTDPNDGDVGNEEGSWRGRSDEENDSWWRGDEPEQGRQSYEGDEPDTSLPPEDDIDLDSRPTRDSSPDEGSPRDVDIDDTPPADFDGGGGGGGAATAVAEPKVKPKAKSRPKRHTRKPQPQTEEPQTQTKPQTETKPDVSKKQEASPRTKPPEPQPDADAPAARPAPDADTDAPAARPARPDADTDAPAAKPAEPDVETEAPTARPESTPEPARTTPRAAPEPDATPTRARPETTTAPETARTTRAMPEVAATPRVRPHPDLDPLMSPELLYSPHPMVRPFPYPHQQPFRVRPDTLVRPHPSKAKPKKGFDFDFNLEFELTPQDYELWGRNVLEFNWLLGYPPAISLPDWNIFRKVFRESKGGLASTNPEENLYGWVAREGSFQTQDV